MKKQFRRSILAGLSLVSCSLLAGSLTSVALATSPNATAIVQLPTDAALYYGSLTTTFMPDGQLLALDSSNNLLITMHADGTHQSVLATIPAPSAMPALAYNSHLNLIVGAAGSGSLSTLYTYTPAGQLVGTVDVHTLFSSVSSIAVTPQGDLIIGGALLFNDPTSHHGLYKVQLSYTSGSSPSISITSSTLLYAGAVTGVAVAASGTIYACTPDALVSMASDGSAQQEISGNRNCRAPSVSGSTLYDAAPSTTQMYGDNLQSVSLTTGQTTVLRTMSLLAMRPFITGRYTGISVNPANVIGGTPGGLTLTELNLQPIPLRLSDEQCPTIYSTDATGGSAKVIALGSQYHLARFVNAVADPSSNYFYVTDQFGGRVLAISPDGTNQRVVISNFRSPASWDVNHVGTYPAVVAPDSKNKYLFVLDGSNVSVVRRFPLAGADFSSSIPRLAARATPTVRGSSSTLYPNSLAVNGSLLYLGYMNKVFSETEMGSTPKTVLTLPTSSTIDFMTTGPDKNIYVGAHGATTSIVILSPTGKVVRTLKLGVAGNPVSIAVDNAGHVFFTDPSGGLNMIAASGVGGVRHLLNGDYTGVAANGQGTILLLSRTEIAATTASRLLN